MIVLELTSVSKCLHILSRRYMEAQTDLTTIDNHCTNEFEWISRGKKGIFFWFVEFKGNLSQKSRKKRGRNRLKKGHLFFGWLSLKRTLPTKKKEKRKQPTGQLGLTTIDNQSKFAGDTSCQPASLRMTALSGQNKQCKKLTKQPADVETIN